MIEGMGECVSLCVRSLLLYYDIILQYQRKHTHIVLNVISDRIPFFNRAPSSLTPPPTTAHAAHHQPTRQLKY